MPALFDRRGLRFRIDELKRGLEKFAQFLTDKYSLQVMFRGTECWTDNKTLIVLPQLSLLEKKDLSAAEMEDALDFMTTVRGWVYHEGGHILFTNFKAFDGYVKEHCLKTPKRKHLMNLLEDFREERKMSIAYKGAKLVLREKAAWYYRKAAEGKDDFDVKKAPFYSQVTFAMHMVCKLKHPDQHPLWAKLDPKAKKFAEESRELIKSAELKEETSEILPIATTLWKRLKKLLTDKEPGASKPEMTGAHISKAPDGAEGGEGESIEVSAKGEDGSDSEEDSESSSGSPVDGSGEEDSEDSDEVGEEGDEGSDDPASDEDAGEEGEGSEGNEEDDEEGSADKPSESPAEEEDEDADKKEDEEELAVPTELEGESEAPDEGKMIERYMEEVSKSAAEHRGDYTYRIYTTEHDVVTPLEKTTQEYAKEIEDAVAGSYGPLKRVIEARMKAKALVYDVGGLSDGEDIDPCSLYRLPMGDEAIYSRKFGTNSHENVVVGVLVDCSGSMAGDKERMARNCAMAIGTVLNAVRVKFGMWGFTGDTYERRSYGGKFKISASREKKLLPHEEALYTRHGGNHYIGVAKGFDEMWSTGRLRVGSLVHNSQNYDGESVAFAATELLRRKEERKILYVLSDGEPCAHADLAKLSRHLKDVCNEIEHTRGIELHGIGMLTDEPKKFYKSWHHVGKLEDLVGVVLKSMEKQIES